MTKINGRVALFEQDYIGDFHSINPRLVKSACDLFWAKRGMRDPGGLTPAEQTRREAEARKRKGGFQLSSEAKLPALQSAVTTP
jgi:hypothetical protein